MNATPLVFSDAQLLEFLASYLWPLFRVAGFFLAVPIIGTRLVPQRIRLGLAMVVTIAIVPVLPPPPAVDPLSLTSVLITAQQLVIGLALGFFVQFMFQLFIVAGQSIAMQMGLGFASMVDPANGISVAVLSQFFLLLTTILFLSMNGHLVMIEVFVESFRAIPVSTFGLSSEGLWGLVNTGTWMFAAALLIALPAVTALLVVNLSFGVMTRSAPQLNIFTIGFPLTMVLGQVILWLSLIGFLPRYENIVTHGFAMMRGLVGIP